MRVMLSLRTQILLLVTLVVAACLSIVAVFAGYKLGAAAETLVGRQMLALAESLALSGEVQRAMESPAPSVALQPLAEKIRRTSQVEFVVFLDMQGIRQSHPNTWLIGQHFTGGDEGPALRGEHYISKAVGVSGPSLRAFVPIIDEEGFQRGVVVVGVFLNSVNTLIRTNQAPLWGAALVSLAVGGLAAWGLAHRVKRTLRGLEPAEIATLLEQRETILGSVVEGVIAVDAAGTITLVNAEACRILRCTPEVVGSSIDQVIPNSRLLRVVETGEPERDRQLALEGGGGILTSRVPIRVNGQVVGAVATFRDRSEVQQLAERLTGIQRFAEGLRAQAHEFANKLQAIKGLLQLRAYDEVLQFVNLTASDNQNKVRQVSQVVHEPAVAGLLLGKISEAAERGIALELAAGSCLELPELGPDPGLLITVLGNLVDNAMESGGDRILLGFTTVDEQLTITVSDNGRGMPLELRGQLFRRGATTKGEGRGHGLANLYEAVAAAGGEAALVETSAAGTTFRIRINMGG